MSPPREGPDQRAANPASGHRDSTRMAAFGRPPRVAGCYLSVKEGRFRMATRGGRP